VFAFDLCVSRISPRSIMHWTASALHSRRSTRPSGLARPFTHSYAEALLVLKHYIPWHDLTELFTTILGNIFSVQGLNISAGSGDASPFRALLHLRCTFPSSRTFQDLLLIETLHVNSPAPSHFVHLISCWHNNVLVHWHALRAGV
jgi:hypothetical protein